MRSLIVRFLSAVWSGADGLRKVLHLVLLLFVFMAFFAALSDVPRGLPDKAALIIQPLGFLVEQLEGDPFDRAISELAGDGKPETLIQDIVDALEYAKDDERIEVVHLELSAVLGAGLSKLQRIAENLARACRWVDARERRLRGQDFPNPLREMRKAPA